MKRDDDLLRDILLDLEKDADWLLMVPSFMNMSEEQRKHQHHVHLLADAGFLSQVGRDGFRMTNAGYDYLEAIKDEGLWKRTKAAVAETGGNATLQIMKDVAAGFLRKKISDHTGLDL